MHWYIGTTMTYHSYTEVLFTYDNYFSKTGSNPNKGRLKANLVLAVVKV